MKTTRWLAMAMGAVMMSLWMTGAQAEFVDNGNGTVSDTVTGLMWQKGDSQNDAGGRNWGEALNYCESLTLPSGGYSDWRLPNIRELETLVDWDRYYPAINITYFPNCRSSWYWSSSYWACDPAAHALYISFYDGYSDNYYKGTTDCVRCVRGPSASFEHFVEPLGACGGNTPCYTTIQAALNAAADGDTVQAAKTLEPAEPVWQKFGTVTISGGWEPDFSANDGTTSMYAPRATGGGGVKIQPDVKIIPMP